MIWAQEGAAEERSLQYQADVRTYKALKMKHPYDGVVEEEIKPSVKREIKEEETKPRNKREIKEEEVNPCIKREIKRNSNECRKLFQRQTSGGEVFSCKYPCLMNR